MLIDLIAIDARTGRITRTRTVDTAAAPDAILPETGCDAADAEGWINEAGWAGYATDVAYAAIAHDARIPAAARAYLREMAI